MTGEKLRIEMDDLTLGEMAEVGRLLGRPLSDVIVGPEQGDALAAVATVIMRRTDPGYTLAQAGELRMRDIEIVAPDPEVSAASNGGTPPASLESGG